MPVEHSKRLYAGAADPKDLWVLPGAGHIQAVRSEAVRKRLTEFLVKNTTVGDTAHLRQ